MGPRMVRLSLAVAALTLFSIVVSCGPTTACNPASCQGCCDASGVCKLGDTASACGAMGQACAVCTGSQSCSASKVCVAPVTGDDAGVVDAGVQPRCGRAPVVCSDQVIQKLSLFDTPNPTPTPFVDGLDGLGFSTEIDATAGAIGGSITPTMSFVYAKFTASGLERVNLSDTAALDSLEWDIAFRRFIIRLNGGDSGPSCTQATIVENTPYEQITAASPTARWDLDDFLSDDCLLFRDDGFGLGTPPLTALTPFYNYAGCVKMTHRSFIIRTRLGKHVKFTVDRYYQNEAGQQFCEAMSKAPGVSAPAGYLKVRWQLLN
jgi:hypothetical protein